MSLIWRFKVTETMALSALTPCTDNDVFTMNARIYLSPPHIGAYELTLVAEAFQTNWIAPLGPHVDGFKRELAAYVNTPHAVALNSGTTAIHLALVALGIGAGHTVWVSTLTFAATAFPLNYVGATPLFADGDRTIVWRPAVRCSTAIWPR